MKTKTSKETKKQNDNREFCTEAALLIKHLKRNLEAIKEYQVGPYKNRTFTVCIVYVLSTSDLQFECHQSKGFACNFAISYSSTLFELFLPSFNS